MDMHMNSESHHDHTTSTHKSHKMDMTMPSTFTSSTTITLFFSAWSTSSPGTYTLALLFLFLLAVLNRLLAALRFQFESADSRSSEPYTSGIPFLAPPRSRRRGVAVRIPKARLSPLPMYMRVGSNKDMDCEEGITEDALLQPLSSTSTRDGDLLAGGSTKEPLWSRVRNTFSFILPNWTASAPWRLKQDGSRAILEGVRAFIGYILMLAVMTLNVGVFIAVLAGIVFGELVLGRYMRHSVWEDGACHD